MTNSSAGNNSQSFAQYIQRNLEIVQLILRNDETL